MIKQPDHPVGQDFDKARDWMVQQERQLTKDQQRDYNKLKQSQKKERVELQQKRETFRRELEDRAKQKKAKAELAYNPPFKTADPHVRKLARDAIAADKKIEQLYRQHKDDRTAALEKFEQQREKQKEKTGQGHDKTWLQAFEKATRQENDRNRDRELSKDFDKSR
jgi:hypothetical protein